MAQSKNLRELDIINGTVPSEIVLQDLQPYFYVAKSFDHMLKQLEDYSKTFEKPF